MEPDRSPRSSRRTRRLVLGTATLAVAVLSSSAVALATHTFADVPHGHPHAEGIGYVAETGVTQGCDATRFCPGDGLTRGQMGTFLYRASGNDPATPPSVNAARLQGRTAAQLRSGIDAATVQGQTAAELREGGNAATLQGQTAAELREGGNAATVQDVTLLGLLESSIPVSGLQPTSDATVQLAGSTQLRGLRLPEAQPTPGFASTVTMPLAKPPTAHTYLDVTWHTAGTSCSVSLRNNFVDVRRPGTASPPAFALIPDAGPSSLIAPATPNEAVVTRYRFNNGAGARLAGGDSVVFGLFRSSASGAPLPDSCTSDVVVSGVAVRFG